MRKTKKQLQEEVKVLEYCIKAYEQNFARVRQENEDLKKKYEAALKEAQKWHEAAHNLDNLRRDALGYD